MPAGRTSACIKEVFTFSASTLTLSGEAGEYKCCDCNDANSAIHPGATDVCGNGVDEDCSGSDLACANVCGDEKAAGSEGCDYGASFCGGNGASWANACTSTSGCPGGYPSVTSRYRCPADCSGIEYNNDPCGSCGDGACNGPETKASCAADCENCGNNNPDAGEVCD